MKRLYGVEKILTTPNVANLTEFLTFIDGLINGVYVLTLGAANVQAIGLPRGTAMVQCWVQSVNFVQLTVHRFDSIKTDYRIYKLSGEWQSEWSTCTFE